MNNTELREIQREEINYTREIPEIALISGFLVTQDD